MQIILYCTTYNYITIINMHMQALYWSCVELMIIKDIHLNHYRKVPNALWTITCTHSLNYNGFNLSKAFIKIYNTDIHNDCIFVLLLDSLCIIANSKQFTHWSDMYRWFLSVQNCALFLDRVTDWIFNHTCSLSHNHITGPDLQTKGWVGHCACVVETVLATQD